jgi:hypothetical protein
MNDEHYYRKRTTCPPFTTVSEEESALVLSRKLLFVSLKQPFVSRTHLPVGGKPAAAGEALLVREGKVWGGRVVPVVKEEGDGGLSGIVTG